MPIMAMTSRKLSIIFFALALSVPILSAIFSKWSGRGEIVAGPTHMEQISGSFAWRFFQWHIIGGNEMINGFDFFLYDTFGIPMSDARTIGGLIDVTHPTLFQVFIVFVIAALIARNWNNQ